MFLAHVPQYPANPFSPQIQTCLNGDRLQLEAQVSELRYWITARRIEKTLQQLPASPFEQLPLTYDLKSHPLSRMGRHKMYVRLHRQPYAILVVDYSGKPGGKVEAPIKRTKFPAYFISDLAHVVAFADERIPFTALEAQLTAKGILHSGIQVSHGWVKKKLIL